MNKRRQLWARRILNTISGLLAIGGFVLCLLGMQDVGISLIIVALIASIVRHHFKTIML